MMTPPPKWFHDEDETGAAWVQDIMQAEELAAAEKSILVRIVLAIKTGHDTITRSLDEHTAEENRRWDLAEHRWNRIDKALYGPPEDPSQGIVNTHFWICRAVRLTAFFAVAFVGFIGAIVAAVYHISHL